MEPANERSLRRLAKQLHKDARAAFVFVVCSDFQLRAELEYRLVAELGSERELARFEWSKFPSDPWHDILAAHRRLGERCVVSVHYDALEHPKVDLSKFDSEGVTDVDDKQLLRLNLGRDIRAREGITLLLWVAGHGPLEQLRTRAPDLWAHRTLAVHFPSVRDFGARSGADFETEQANHEVAAQEQLERARWPWLSPRERIEALQLAAFYLFNSGSEREAARVVAELRIVYDANHELHDQELPTAQVFAREFKAATDRNDWAKLDERLASADVLAQENDWPLLAASIADAKESRVSLRGRSSERLDAFEQGLRHTGAAQELENSGPGPGPGPSLVNRAAFRCELGDPIRARVDIDAAARAAADLSSLPFRHQVWSFVEHGRAECAQLLGHPQDALRWTRLAAQRRTAMRTWALLRGTMNLVRRLYLDLGCPGLARSELLILVEQHGPGNSTIRRRGHKDLATLAQATGDLQVMQEQSRIYFALRESNAGCPTTALLDCSEFARQGYAQWDDVCELSKWRHALDDQLAHATSSDFRDLLSLERARWHLLLNEPSQAAALADGTLPFRRAQRGPSPIAAACVLAAQAHRRERAFGVAEVRLSEARDALVHTREEARPFDAWKEVMLETAELAIAQDDPDAAWQAIDDALAFARLRCLKVEQMRLLLHQARQELGSLRGREAAVQSLLLASELGYLRDEGQIRLTLAEQAKQAGELDEARIELVEALWLLDRLGPPGRCDQAHVHADQLGVGSE